MSTDTVDRPLKILIYGINFAPELTGVGKYTGEMAAWLARRGHEVRVITAPPYYPDWEVGEGHRGDRYALQRYEGIRVRRVPLYVPRKPSGLNRMLHLASFAITSLPSVFRQILWKPDIVWTVEPTLFCAPATLALGRLTGARTWFHIQDFEVNAGFGLGMLRGSGLKRAVLAVESWVMRRFDTVSTISDRMAEMASRKGARNPVELLPNWVDTDTIRPLSRRSRYRQELNISDDAIVLLYSGNMGAKQGLSILAETAARLADDDRIVFVLCGSGSYRKTLGRECASLPNVRFLPLQPLEQLNELLNAADVHLLPQRADASDIVMPSKLSGMLASGRPIIATALRASSLADAVKECGVVVSPGDATELTLAIRRLADDAGLRIELGNRARELAHRFSTSAVLERFESRLVALAAEARGARREPEPALHHQGLADRNAQGVREGAFDIGVTSAPPPEDAASVGPR